MKKYVLFAFIALFYVSSSAWAQYVKVTAEDGTESWIEIEGIINGTNIEIYGGLFVPAIDKNTKGSIDLNEVWSRSGGRGTNYQVTSIGNCAFLNCSGLTSITIPNSVTSIKQEAFAHCSGLISITSYITEVFETGRNSFIGCENATLYVPKGLVSTYRSTVDWDLFNKIEEIPGIALAMSCNNKGKVTVNGGIQFTNDMGEVSVYDGMDNSFIFQPKENCELRQVLIDGLDVTVSVENNQLTTKVHEGSKMMVIFDKTGYDVNGDGNVDISDVVKLVNFILGQ